MYNAEKALNDQSFENSQKEAMLWKKLNTLLETKNEFENEEQDLENDIDLIRKEIEDIRRKSYEIKVPVLEDKERELSWRIDEWNKIMLKCEEAQTSEELKTLETVNKDLEEKAYKLSGENYFW